MTQEDPARFGFPLFATLTGLLGNDEPARHDAVAVLVMHPSDLLLVGDHLNCIGANQVVNLLGLGFGEELSFNIIQLLLIELFATLLCEIGQRTLLLEVLVVVGVVLGRLGEDLQVLLVGNRGKVGSAAPLSDIICAPRPKICER